MASEDGRAAWDAELAEALLGAKVLIGLTFCRANGEETHREQMHGVVVSVDKHEGITVRLEGVRRGETYTVPPDPSSFRVANPGVYRLRSTGEEIEDPDYTTSWTINAPD